MFLKYLLFCIEHLGNFKVFGGIYRKIDRHYFRYTKKEQEKVQEFIQKANMLARALMFVLYFTESYKGPCCQRKNFPKNNNF